ncbi:MAG TPA: hypothetical protein VJU16_05165, partial [Planctomycetota bacterium]|nr:hypothetical protein [Planctomycetota bacterium]
MRLLVFDLAVNLAMLALDAAVLVVLWKKRNARLFLVTLGAGVGVVGIGVMASMVVLGIFGAMRALAWAIFVHGLVVLAGGAVLLWKPQRRFAVAAAVASALTLLVGVDAFFVEPHWLEVTHVKVSSSKVSRRFKIAIVADIQTDVVGDYERG